MLNIGDIVKINIDYVDVNNTHNGKYINRLYFPKNEKYKVIEIVVPEMLGIYKIKGLKTKNIYQISEDKLTKIEDLENISQRSLNSTMEELYEMILKENCSKELKNKFWDLHKVLSTKEKEVKTRLEEINKLLWE